MATMTKEKEGDQDPTQAPAAGRPRGRPARIERGADRRRHRAARLRQGEAHAGRGRGGRQRQAARRRQPRQAAGEGRRPRAVHHLGRRDVQGRRRRAAADARGRHPRRFWKTSFQSVPRSAWERTHLDSASRTLATQSVDSCALRDAERGTRTTNTNQHRRYTHAQNHCLRSRSPRSDSPRRRQAGQGRQGHARSQGPQRHPAEELRLARP